MFVNLIEFGSPTRDTSARDPSWAFVETYLRSLNGDKKDGVILGSSGNSYMGISGGRNNQYLVAGYLDGYGSFVFSGGSENDTPQEVVVNGDFSTYASENVADLEEAVAAAKVFYERGALAEQFKWENEPRSR